MMKLGLHKKIIYWFAITAVSFGSAVVAYQSRPETPTFDISPPCLSKTEQQVWIEGGSFTMGQDHSYREEGPAHEVFVDGFWIDAHEVTNAQFAKFVNETGYITVAERPPQLSEEDAKLAPPELKQPGSAIFTPPSATENKHRVWSYLPGANWQHPEGPHSSVEGREHYPVIHIAFEDAQAYAKWAGRSLPTEAQYEFAAQNQTKDNANTWQGKFPTQNSKEDGFKGIAPVGCFPANANGTYDLIGNVWEWTANWYASRHNPADNINPKGPDITQSGSTQHLNYPVRVIKGGSYLCAPNYCMRYRPAARHAQDTGLGTNHIGFRTVLNKRSPQ